MDFQYRQYDPQIGRFLSVDPLADNGQEEWSPYAAMGNNPAMMVDPLGLKFDMGVLANANVMTAQYNTGGRKDNSPGSKDRDGSFEDFLKLGLMGSAAVTAMEKQEMVDETYAEAMGMYPEASKGEAVTNDMAASSRHNGPIGPEVYVDEGTNGENPNDQDAQTKDSESSSPTRDKGGFIKGYSNFYKFMVDKAQNEKNEVSGVLVVHKTKDERSYFVFPWENNTPDNSASDFDLIGTDDYWIIVQYHTHQVNRNEPGDGLSKTDAIWSRDHKGMPVHSINKNGDIWRITIKPGTNLPNIPSNQSYGELITQGKF